MAAKDEDAHVAHAPNRKSLLLMTGGAAAGAAVILLTAILPAEFNIDPLGLGKATGLSRLWAPKEKVLAPAAGAQPLARYYAGAFRTDVVEIPLAVSGDAQRGDELEYKVYMQKGATLVFDWVEEGAPEGEFYYDFHSHTLPTPTQSEMTVSTYKQAIGTGQKGALTAPFDGIHGWYFQNQAVTKAKVKLRLSGYYDLIPVGQMGNERGIVARPVTVE